MAESAPLRVLLVEDDENDAELLVRELARSGHRVVAHRVDSAVQLERALASAKWDVVVSDWSLPGFDGSAALRLVRARSVDLPFIIVSGSIEEEQAVGAMRAGANDFVTKARLARLGPAVARELREARERQESRDQARAAQERLQLLIEHMPALSYIAAAGSPHGATLFVGPQIAQMSGFAATDWLADSGLWWRQIHPDDRPRIEAGTRRRSAEGPNAIEYRLVRRDGRVVRWRDESRLVWDEGAHQFLVHGCIQDVTEARRVEEEMQAQREALHQTEKLAAMGRLLAGLAHELNNPLAIALGQASLLERRLGESGEAPRVRKIVKAVERAARIVQNFLSLARQKPATRSPIHVSAVIREVLELVSHALHLDGIEIRLDLEPDLPEVSGDADQLQQVFLNLLTNAHQALREHGGPRWLRVSTRYDAERQRVAASVEDSGPGIPQAALPRIFEPFFTTKPPGHGTGLGLSLCMGIVESHGGTIYVESRPGFGARFQVELPLRLAHDEAAAEPARESRAQPEGALRLLVVDDEEDVAELLADILQEEGHEVDVAHDGKEALVRMEATPYDLVLTDLRMPRLDGPGLHAEVARRWPGREQRLVFVTGDGLGAELQQFLARSGARHLVKPFSVGDLRRLLGEVSATLDAGRPSAPPREGSPRQAADG